MGSLLVVLHEPGGEGVAALLVAEERLPVGPLGLQRAVEPLHLAVGPGAVRLDEDGWDASVGQQRLPGGAVPVGERVVGQHALHHDAVRGEERQRSGQERRAARRTLVVESLAVGQPL